MFRQQSIHNMVKEANNMKFFIDTINVDEIQKADKMGILSGVTTNLSLITKETLNDIAEIIDVPIIGEVKPTAITTEEIIKESIEIAAMHPNMIVKIPMSENGLLAIKELSSKEIKTNVTLVSSVNQALFAAQAGANYVSPFMTYLDIGIELIQNIAQTFKKYKWKTNIIAESIRNPNHILDCAMVGADIVTVPFSVLEQLTKSILTDTKIKKL